MKQKYITEERYFEIVNEKALPIIPKDFKSQLIHIDEIKELITTALNNIDTKAHTAV